MLKRILLFTSGLLLMAQFIQPDRSVPVLDPSNDMLAVTNAPTDIQGLIAGACYDCHSYKTNYPWYGWITPVNFIVQNHIKEGREVLNYSVWDKYVGTEAAGESGETVQEGEMPPGYYRFMHGHGDLTAAQRQQLITWFGGQGGAEGGPDGGDGGDGSEREEEHGER